MKKYFQILKSINARTWNMLIGNFFKPQRNFGEWAKTFAIIGSVFLALFYDIKYLIGFYLFFMMVNFWNLDLENYDHDKDYGSDLVYYIRSNQLQSLRELLEFDPSLSKIKYKRKTLTYWAKKYNNEKANTIILEYMKKSI
jgi:hypothetical protein